MPRGKKDSETIVEKRKPGRKPKQEKSDVKNDIVEIGWLKDVEEKPVRWLWEPFIAYEDVTIIEGNGGEGKTTLILKIAAMLSNGQRPPALVKREFQPCEEITPEVTFYATSENKMATATVPVFRMLHGIKDFLAYAVEDKIHFTLTEESLVAAITQTNAKLVIIDPYQAFLPEETKFNDAVSMRRFISMVSKVAEITGTAIVLVGHFTKSNNTNSIYRGFGSGDTINAIRNLLVVESDPLSDERYMRILKSNYYQADRKSKIVLNMDENGYLDFSVSLTTAEGERPTESALCANAIRMMLADGPMKAAEVKTELVDQGYALRTVERTFHTLNGHSYKNGNTWMWNLPEE